MNGLMSFDSQMSLTDDQNEMPSDRVLLDFVPYGNFSRVQKLAS